MDHDNNNANLIDNRYRKVEKLGEGGYGRVTKCCLITQESNLENDKKFFAVKKYFLKKILNFNNDPEPYTENFVKQQFELIQSLDHPNIIKGLEIFEYKRNQYIVFEYFSTDLSKILKKEKLKISEIKLISKQIFSALRYLHKLKIIHRDLKPENIIIDDFYKAILCDFDLAKKFENLEEKKCKNVCTVYYKPPEILMGSQFYDESIDIWGVGCIIAEMILQKPLFEHKNDILVLYNIFDMLGMPNEQNWPSYKDIPNGSLFSGEEPGCGIKAIFKKNNCEVPDLLIDLLNKIFVYESKNRISASDALNHTFFT